MRTLFINGPNIAKFFNWFLVHRISLTQNDFDLQVVCLGCPLLLLHLFRLHQVERRHQTDHEQFHALNLGHFHVIPTKSGANGSTGNHVAQSKVNNCSPQKSSFKTQSFAILSVTYVPFFSFVAFHSKIQPISDYLRMWPVSKTVVSTKTDGNSGYYLAKEIPQTWN